MRLTLPNDSRRRIRQPQEATNLHCLGFVLPKCSCENINNVLLSFSPYILWLLSSRSNTEQEAGRSGRLRFLQPHPGQGDAHLSVNGSPSPPEDPPSHSSSPNAPEGHRPLEETLDSRLKPTSPSFQFQVLWLRESLLHCSRNIWTPFASNTLSLSLSLSCSHFLTSAFFFLFRRPN